MRLVVLSLLSLLRPEPTTKKVRLLMKIIIFGIRIFSSSFLNKLQLSARPPCPEKRETAFPICFYSPICSMYWLCLLICKRGDRESHTFTLLACHTRGFGFGRASDRAIACLLACCDQADCYLSGNQDEAKGQNRPCHLAFGEIPSYFPFFSFSPFPLLLLLRRRGGQALERILRIPPNERTHLFCSCLYDDSEIENFGDFCTRVKTGSNDDDDNGKQRFLLMCGGSSCCPGPD